MKLNHKVKISIVIVVVVILAVASFFYVKNSGSRKAEIKMSDNSENINTNDVPQEGANDTNTTGNQPSTPEKNPAKNNDTPAKNNVGINIINQLVNFGFQAASGRSIDTIIIHSTYDAIGGDPFSVAGVIAEYKSYGVSPHYLIDRKGNVYRLVEDKNIAYHAGVSQTPDGRANVNNFSIGIEIINTKTDKVTDAQYAALNDLIAQLKNEYKIKYVLGHNQIAPGRKDDPWNFDPALILDAGARATLEKNY